MLERILTEADSGTPNETPNETPCRELDKEQSGRCRLVSARLKVGIPVAEITLTCLGTAYFSLIAPVKSVQKPCLTSRE